MKGFSPNLSVKTQKETASKKNNKFIELGVLKDNHDDSCKCENCTNLNNK